jgi:DNA helicase-2/ATP-dependent DNA helicase PcrA
MPNADRLAFLNPEQRSAVCHGLALENDHAPLVIIAGAGSGKTEALARRVADCGEKPGIFGLVS